jgi:serine/threonine protein kinase
MAPEVRLVLDVQDSSSEYTNAVDIWATGCIVYRLVAGHVPFPQIKSLVKYCEDESLFLYDDPFGSGTEKDGSTFLRQLLISDPNGRPTASQALKHSWIISGGSHHFTLLACGFISVYFAQQVLWSNALTVECPCLLGTLDGSRISQCSFRDEFLRTS